ncbi:MAG: DUF4157 domain-containing protein, partial [bacterium]|nr:DUF4157 domain-containing protein [bacterium]
GGPGLAAKHLIEIHQSFGNEGVRRTVNGLQATRGNQFVVQMMRNDAVAKRLASDARETAAAGPPGSVRTALSSRDSGTPLRSAQREMFRAKTGADPSGVRILNNDRSHRAAAAIGARAFTLGNRIFFAKGQYNPVSLSGRRLLFHEVAHTYQQRNATMPPMESLTMSGPHDRQERQADQVAWSVANSRGERGANVGGHPEFREVAAAGRLSVARLQRAISFTTTDGTFTTNNMGVHENAAGFRFQSVVPTFQWQPSVTIHGSPGDRFTEWEAAHHQVAKSFWRNVYWGFGTNRTRRRYYIRGGLPMRDATAAGNTWYHDAFARGFGANGDIRQPIIRDSPGSARHPWNNPTAGRTGNRGFFNYGFGFVATLSARHTPTGTGARAFRHLNHVHWNFGIGGNFNAARALNSRVSITTGGPINRSGVYSGRDPANPPMHGGDIVNNNFRHTDT